METKNLPEIPQQLSKERKDLIQLIQDARLPAQEMGGKNTSEEWDRVSVSQVLHLVDNLNQNVLACLKTVRRAIQSLQRSQKPECAMCGKVLPEERLQNVPWATTCDYCQKSTESDETLFPM